MQTEIEVKFLRLNHDDFRQKLIDIGATQVAPFRIMRRKNYDYPDRSLDAKGGWVRARDEGGGITLSYKQVDDRSLHGTKEVCLQIDSFDEADKFLTAIGLEVKSTQETKRESWELDGVQIELDEWPWVPPYIELEAKNEAALTAVLDKLGLDVKNGVHGSVEIAYQDIYDVTESEVNRMAIIEFTEVPGWLEERRRGGE